MRITFVYFGSIIRSNGYITEKIKRRIGMVTGNSWTIINVGGPTKVQTLLSDKGITSDINWGCYQKKNTQVDGACLTHGSK
jgi:hypothetical protein